MKIFEIGTGYTSIPARMGAATEIVVEELTKSFRKMNQDVTIIDIKDKNRLPNNLPIIETYMPQAFSSTDVKLGIVHKMKRVLYSISLTYKLHSLIRKYPGEKIILHFHNQYNLFFFLKLAPDSLRQKVTIGYTVHSYIWFGKWEAITPSITNTEATVSIASEKTDTKHKAFDYIVKYEEQSSFEGNPHPYYVESLKGDGQEAANKGYYFTIQGADASKREIAGNAEELTVTAYDWKERKNGPEAYKVYIKNNNIDGDWHLVATVPVTDKGYGAITEGNDTGITVSNPAGTVLRFTPEFTTDDVHTKYLKVLRDYKHYYKIEAVRTITDSDGVETEITAVLGDDDSIWGARQITAKEMVKAATLAMSEGMRRSHYKTGAHDWAAVAGRDATYTEEGLGHGSVRFYVDGRLKQITTHHIFTDYTPELITKSGSNTVFLTISSNNKELIGKSTNGVSTCPPEYWTTNEQSISISGPIKELYNASIKFITLRKDINMTSSSFISLIYGGQEFKFGNVTPFPFGHYDWKNNTDIDYQNDSEEWK